MTEGMKRSKAMAWLQLLRAPNLLTVPGDPVAGYLLAMHGGVPRMELLGAVLASLFFYCAGLLLNDVRDLDEDRRDRPTRPLPAGEVPARQALLVSVLLFAAGLATSAALGQRAFGAGLALAGAIVVYNLVVKDIPVLGPFTMGWCRALSLLLGAAANPFFHRMTPGVAVASCVLILYIGCVTHLAKQEVIAGPAGRMTLPQLVGLLLRLLFVLQAAFVFASGTGEVGWLAGAILLALWPVSSLLSRRFYMS